MKPQFPSTERLTWQEWRTSTCPMESTDNLANGWLDGPNRAEEASDRVSNPGLSRLENGMTDVKTEAVEYVVRKAPTGTKWDVWMIELDASVAPPVFQHSVYVSSHRTMESADKKAAQLRTKDEAHIAKVCGTRRFAVDPAARH